MRKLITVAISVLARRRRDGSCHKPMRARVMSASSITAALAVLMLAAGPASASPWNRSCGGSGDGSLSSNEQWETSGPWHVGMSYQTALSIDRRVGPDEFARPGTHPPVKYVPCTVAQAVSFKAMDAWVHWGWNSGVVGAGWIGYAFGPYFGRFHCHGRSTSNGGARETCTHYADAHAGQMTVSLRISPNPYWPYK